MKLVFPGGEHAPTELAEGVTRIGSDPSCEIALAASGIAAHHCEITVEAGNLSARPLDPGAPTVLNGRQVDGPTVLSVGDLLVLGHVGCQLTASGPPVAPPVRPVPKAHAIDDGRTRVRTALPKYLLRGVSGVTFGKTFAVTDNAILGRQPECEIPVPADEISRQHVRLKVTPEGVHVEDMGSANGTYINNKRVQSGLLLPGEELRLDTVRFLLLTPGMDARQQSAPSRSDTVPASASGKPSPLSIAIIVLVLAVVAFFALRYAGML
ncbi:MAG: FHA domain-containing protein [Dokdonella sp.]